MPTPPTSKTPAKEPVRFGVTLVRDADSNALDVRMAGTASIGPDAIEITTRLPGPRGPSTAQKVDLQPEEAVQLAAYLVAMALLAGLAPAQMLYDQYFRDARAAGQRHLAQKFPGFISPPPGEPPTTP